MLSRSFEYDFLIFCELMIFKDNSSSFEFTIAVRGSVANDSFLLNAEQRVKDAMDRTIQAVWEGRLN